METECITDYCAVKVEHGDKGSDEHLTWLLGAFGTRQWLHFRCIKNWDTHGTDILLELPTFPGLAGLGDFKEIKNQSQQCTVGRRKQQ